MSVPFPIAHIGGVPVEEGLPAVVPATCALVVVVRARLGGIAAWRRRR
jgi:hypothetical protein